MEETWKDVKGYEGHYQVSNFGRVRSVPRQVSCLKSCSKEIGGIILKQRINYKGYCYVELSKDCKIKGRFVQRLVAEAFLPNPDNLPVVNHKSEDKLDNRVENLEWCSYSYNNTYGSLSKKLEQKKRAVLQLTTPTHQLVKRYDSLSSAARENGYSAGNICMVCKGKWKTAYGYVWKYENE